MLTDKTKEFIDKSKDIHGDLYDYSKVNYISNLIEVIIICKIHGDFLQLPKTHKRGSGCVNCSIIKRKEKRTSTLDEFISKANETHNSKYNYYKVDYVNAQTKVIITCKIHGDFEQTPNAHLIGQGCRKCSNEFSSITRKSNTDEFITKAIKVHDNKYDYSCVDYISASDKVIIKCKKHGFFEQTPNSHLCGRGCDKCAGRLITTQYEFINFAKQIHKNAYDYSKVMYTNSQTKVIITCKIHGDFEQVPATHIHKNAGCYKCAGKLSTNQNEFITRANEIHKNTYEYSKVIYINSQTKVLITCKNHGDFEQIPNSHLQGCGCNECGKIIRKDKQLFTLDEFISKANEIHNNMYDYSKVNYTGANNDVIIICKKHNEFNQKPSKHINTRQGCPKCAFTNYSKQQISWLNFISKFFKINIQHAENGGEYLIGNIKADGYCKENNTVYEYHGDFWHGNPKIYNQHSINKKNNKTFGELYQSTLKREKQIVDMGFNLMKIWESDWIKINKSIKILQRKFKKSFNS